MKDPWTDIHDRLNNFELPEPDGLWEGIEQRLDMQTPPTAHRRKSFPIILRRIIDAAAIIAFALMIFNLLIPETNLEYPVAPIASVHKNPLGPTAESRVAVNPKNKAESFSAKSKSLNKQYARIAEVSSEDMETPVAGSDPSASIENNQENELPVTANDSISPDNLLTPYGNKEQIAGKHRETPARRQPKAVHAGKGNLSIGVFSSGTLAMDMSGKRTGAGGTSMFIDYNGTGVKPMSFPIPADPLVPSKYYGLNSSYKENSLKKFHHRQPVRIGLTVSYPLSDRLAIESGLSYSYLGADMKDGTETNFTAASQDLHYLGIPLNLKYSPVSFNKIHLYVSAGAMTEKMVSGRLTERMIIENKQHQTNTEKIHIDQLQWSANGALGLECDLVKPIGVYVEPGVSYFFDNGSQVNTIYKEKPWNFNIQIGVRLKLGQ